MVPDAIKQAASAGLLSKEALAFFWALDRMEAGQHPSIRDVVDGVKAEWPRLEISGATAWRGLWKAAAQRRKRRRNCRKFPPRDKEGETKPPDV